MRTAVRRWGNSLAIRIPRAMATESQLQEGALVDLSSVNGKIELVPVRAKGHSLAELLAGVTPQNRHSEVSTGKRRGKEAW